MRLPERSFTLYEIGTTHRLTSLDFLPSYYPTYCLLYVLLYCKTERRNLLCLVCLFNSVLTFGMWWVNVQYQLKGEMGGVWKFLSIQSQIQDFYLLCSLDHLESSNFLVSSVYSINNFCSCLWCTRHCLNLTALLKCGFSLMGSCLVSVGMYPLQFWSLINALEELGRMDKAYWTELSAVLS